MEYELKGPFCQSCSMPMGKPEDFGTDERGFRINDYCHYCFKNGKFTSPDITMEQMIAISIKCMVNQGYPMNKAEEISKTYIPMLKRWKVDR